ncbi:MAG: two-component regulator propeller domain-containing protein [Bacteroidota bacterium]
MRRVLLFLGLLFPCSGYAYQSYKMVHLSTDDGLSQNLVFDMEQDHQGFIWIGTKDGLNRFDGYRFKIFRNNPSDSTSISSNYVTFIKEDSDNNIWVVTRPGGLHFYDRFNDRFIQINKRVDAPRAYFSATFRGLRGSASTGWWLATTKGLYHLSSDKSKISAVTVNGQSTAEISSFTESDQPGMVYFSAANLGVFRLNMNEATVKPIPEINRHLDEVPVDHLFINKEGNWVILQHHSLMMISPVGALTYQKNIPAVSGEPEITFNALQQDDSGRYFAVRGYTFYEFNPITAQLQKIEPVEWANNLMIDRTGVFWIGTSGYGLYKYDPKTQRFGFTSKRYTEVMAPGFYAELAKRDNYGVPQIYNTIMGVTGTYNRESWVLTRRLGLFKYNLRTGQLRKHAIRIPNNNDTTYTAFAMDELGNGDFAILFTVGIIMFNPEEGTKDLIPMSKIYPHYAWDQNRPNFENLTLLKQHAGYFWVGSTELGLSVYDLSTGESRQFTYDKSDPHSISSNHILSIAPDPHQPERYVWIGTDGGGINRMEIESGEMKRFTEADGLPNNVIYAIYPDDNGHLWMSSNKGIIRLDPETFEIMNFTKGDGLQSDEFNRREHYRFADGRILFGGTFGSNLFDPDKVELNRATPTVAFTDVSVMNNSVLPFGSDWFTSNDSLTTLHVDWNQNIISFEFSALEFSAPSKNRYRYRFPPFVNDWTEMGARREITFTNLDPGTYQLEVSGSNNDGVWSANAAILGVVVSPPFWMTAWFRFSMILLAASSLAAIVWYISQRKQRRKVRQLEYKMAVNKERLRISRDMHDDLGGRLTQIHMMSQFATGNNSYPDEIKQQFSEISQEAREVIQNFSEIVWSLNPQNDTLDNLVDFMVQYSENFCRRVEIQCRIYADEHVPEIEITSNSRHYLLSVLKEALNNAAKYAQCSVIEIHFTLNDGRFLMTISDNGIGFDRTKVRRSGQGLESMESRVRSIGGTFKLNTARREGTAINVSWPLPNHTKG